MSKVTTITIKAPKGEDLEILHTHMLEVALGVSEGVTVEGLHADHEDRSWFTNRTLLMKAVSEDLPF